MNEQQKPRLYREIIDELVRMCRSGQGQIGARRAREGIWNRNATQDFIPEQHQINLLLQRISPAETGNSRGHAEAGGGAWCV